MLCVKCKKEIADGSAFCNWCGKKQAVEKKRSRKRANSQGSVYKLSGNRTRPWIAIMPCKYDREGNATRTVLGYYSTKTDALNDLNNAVTVNVSNRVDMTMEKCYEEWSGPYFKELQKSRIASYKSVWKNFKPLHKKRIKDLRANDVQKIIDDISKDGSKFSVSYEIKVLYGLLCRYAMSLDIIYQDYSKFIKLPKTEKSEKKIFTCEQIEQIYDIAKSGNETAMIICILIYTGFRIGELFGIKREQININEKYMIGGEKTEAGKNRIIPFNDKIISFIQYFYNQHNEYLITYNGKQVTQKKFRVNMFYPFLESIGITGITPHCTRHTFATLGQAAGVAPEDMIKLIGHSDYSITTENYIHQNLETLRKAINKIQ